MVIIANPTYFRVITFHLQLSSKERCSRLLVGLNEYLENFNIRISNISGYLGSEYPDISNIKIYSIWGPNTSHFACFMPYWIVLRLCKENPAKIGNNFLQTVKNIFVSPETILGWNWSHLQEHVYVIKHVSKQLVWLKMMSWLSKPAKNYCFWKLKFSDFPPNLLFLVILLLWKYPDIREKISGYEY